MVNIEIHNSSCLKYVNSLCCWHSSVDEASLAVTDELVNCVKSAHGDYPQSSVRVWVWWSYCLVYKTKHLVFLISRNLILNFKVKAICNLHHTDSFTCCCLRCHRDDLIFYKLHITAEWYTDWANPL